MAYNDKRFSVLLHVGNQRRLERDVVCSSVDALLGTLEQRLGSRILEAQFFNPLRNQYQPLTPNDFGNIPRNVELQVLLGPPGAEDNDNGESGGKMEVYGPSRLSFKGRVVQHIQRLLLPQYNAGDMSKEELVSSCAQICQVFVKRRQIEDAELQSTRKELSLQDQDILRELVKLHRDSTRRVPRARPRYQSPPRPHSPRAGGGATGFAAPAPSSSLFSSVSYTVAGTFPAAPPGVAPSDAALRVTLAPPIVADSEQDVVLVGSVQSRSSVALCWWLSYGPQRIVLNLDKMYASHLVTTFQVSENSFILTFRKGSLVPQWEYFVHLSVTSADGATAAAQASFLVPSTNAQLPAIGSQAVTNEKVFGNSGPQLGKTTLSGSSPARRHLDGYSGDGELGPLRETSAERSPAADAPQQEPSPVRSLVPQKTAPMQLMAAHGDASSGGAPPVTTYQEQLKYFFVNQVEPLYYLSANPVLTENEFKSAIKEVARDFWFRYTDAHALTDDIKRDIVREVKTRLAYYRNANATSSAQKAS